MRIRQYALAGLLLAHAGAAAAEGVSGQWNATVETPQGPFPLVFELVAQGTELMGSVLVDFMGAMPISEGVIDGKKLSFKLVIDGGPAGPITVNYNGVVDGDELSLTSTFVGAPPPGAGPAEQSFTAIRAQ